MRQTYQRLLRAIDHFLFDACDPIVCSLIRLALACVLIVYVAVWLLEAEVWFSDAGVLRAATAQQIGNYHYWSLLFWLPSTPAVVAFCLVILLIQSLLLLLGCWSRFQAACIFVWLVSFQHRNGLICDGQDVLIRMLVFYMIFMPLDYAWSPKLRSPKLRSPKFRLPSLRLPSLRLRSEPARNHIQQVVRKPSAWGLRLMQFQITAIYLSTVSAKWLGLTWRDGTALFYVSRMEDIYGRFWLPEFLFQTPWILKSLTWGVLGLEALLPLLLWIRPTRRLAIVAGIGFHLSIEYAMHLFLFEWLMIVGLLSFIRPTDWRTGRFQALAHPRPAYAAANSNETRDH